MIKQKEKKKYLLITVIIIILVISLISILLIKIQSQTKGDTTKIIDSEILTAENQIPEFESIPEDLSDMTKIIVETAEVYETLLPEEKSKKQEYVINVAKERQDRIYELIQEGDLEEAQDELLDKDTIAEISSDFKEYIEQEVELEGYIEVYNMDYFEEGYSEDETYLVSDNSTRHRLYSIKEEKFIPNQKVKINGWKIKDVMFLDDQIGSVENLLNEKEVVSEETIMTSGSGIDYRKTAIILINFLDSNIAYPKEYVKSVLFTSPNSVNAFFQEISYNKIGLSGYYNTDGDIYGYYTLNVNGIGTGCLYTVWAEQARTLAAQDGFNLENYDHVLYGLPAAITGCPASAWANVSGKNSYYRSLSSTSAGHEMGHNLGLGHSSSYRCTENGNPVILSIANNCIVSTYGDIYDSMGNYNARRHYNSYYKSYDAFSGVHPALPFIPYNKVLKLVSPDQNGTYTISTVEKINGDLPQLLIIKRIVNAGDPIPPVYNYISIEARENYGVDYFDPQSHTVANGILIRLVAGNYTYFGYNTYLLDATPLTNDATTGLYDAALTVGQTFNDPFSELSITVLDRTTSTATIQINFGSATSNGCVRQAPTISVSPVSQTGDAGDTLTYNITSTNRDSVECRFYADNSLDTFKIGASLPQGFSSSPTLYFSALEPSNPSTYQMQITSDSSLGGGNYDFNFYSINLVTNMIGIAPAIYVINQQGINTYTLTYTAAIGGTISGTTLQTVAQSGSGTPVTAVPNTGYRFVQWSDNSTQNPRTDTSVSQNINVTAQFAINTYTVIFKNYDGTILKTQQVNYGGSATAPANPTRTGYTFTGWSPAFNYITSDLNVTAQYSANTYTVIFKDYDGTILKTQQVNYGGSATAPANPTRTGYTFTSWSVPFTNITSNLTITALYTIKQLTLTYTAGANGAILGATSQIVNYGSSGTPVTAVPNNGYHFVQWSDNSTLNPRTDTSVTENVNVQAIFAQDQEFYQLTYTAGANGSLEGEINQTVLPGENGTEVIAIPKTNYHFVQWSDGSTTNPRKDIAVISNIDVTAEFAINIYTLSYTAGNGGTITGDENQSVTHGGEGTEVTAIAKTGYIFEKWSDGYLVNIRKDINVTTNISVTAQFKSKTTSSSSSSSGSNTTYPIITTETIISDSKQIDSSNISFILADSNLSSLEIQKYSNINSNYYEIKRGLEVTKTVKSRNITTYSSKIIISVTNISGKDLINLKALEIIPKEIATSAAEITSTSSYRVAQEDPILEFDANALAVGETIEFSYSLTKQITETQLNNMEGVLIISENAIEDLPLSDTNFPTVDINQKIQDENILVSEEIKEEPEVEKKEVNYFVILGGLGLILLIIILIFVFIKKSKPKINSLQEQNNLPNPENKDNQANVEKSNSSEIKTIQNK